MLKKLMKYDFREQGRSLMPIQLAVVAGGLLAGICLSLSVSGMINMPEATQPSAVNTILIILVTLIMMCIMASSIVTQVMIAKQYYQSCFSDEGYLTFTLPVRTTDILVSKMLTGGAWVMINFFAVLLGTGLFMWIGLGGTSFPAEFAKGFAELKTELAKLGFDISLTWLCVKYLVLLLISSVGGAAMLHFVVTVGNQLARKHKVLCAVGLYLLLTFVISVISGLMSNVMMLPVYVTPDPSAQQMAQVFDRMMSGTFILSIVSMAAMFFFTDRMIKNKLNLE